MAQDTRKYKILLADDEERICRHITGKIEKCSAYFSVVDTAADGQELLEKIKVCLPNVVFTDIRMPVMDGLEAAARICELYPHIKTVILSGYNDFVYAQAAIRSRVHAYLLKPVKTQELTKLLAELALLLADNDRELSQLTDTGGAQQLCELVKQYLQQHYSEQVNLAQLAEALHYTPAHLTKIFSQYVGCTPVKYLTEIRINAAGHLLGNSQVTVAQVGKMVGYPDQYYFSRIFKQKMGISPQTFREKKVAGNL